MFTGSRLGPWSSRRDRLTQGRAPRRASRGPRRGGKLSRPWQKRRPKGDGSKQNSCGQDVFRFHALAAVVPTNHRPRTKGGDELVVDLKPIPFDVTIPSRGAGPHAAGQTRRGVGGDLELGAAGDALRAGAGPGAYPRNRRRGEHLPGRDGQARAVYQDCCVI